MMKVIEPLSSEAQSTAYRLLNNPRSIQVTFCHHIKRSSYFMRIFLNTLINKLPERNSALIDHRMNGIKSQTIQMKISEPVERIACKILAYTIAPLSIKVDGLTPWRR